MSQHTAQLRSQPKSPHSFRRDHPRTSPRVTRRRIPLASPRPTLRGLPRRFRPHNLQRPTSRRFPPPTHRQRSPLHTQHSHPRSCRLLNRRKTRQTTPPPHRHLTRHTCQHVSPQVIPHMCPHRSLPWHRHRRPARTCSSLMSCLQSTARPPSLPHSGLNFSTSSIRSSVTFPSHHMA